MGASTQHFQQNFNDCNNCVMFYDTSKLKIGKNITVNRLKLIHGLVDYEWLNFNIETYKIKCKSKFLI